MRRIFIWLIWIIIVVLIVGCEETGYVVVIRSNRIKYDNLQQIQRLLEDRGFKTVVLERKNDMTKYPGEIYTMLEKKLSNKPYHVVDIDLNYVKDVPYDFVHNLRIYVSNVYKGMTVNELKEEIDNTGNLIYRELVDKVGKENVVIERKETNNRLRFY